MAEGLTAKLTPNGSETPNADSLAVILPDTRVDNGVVRGRKHVREIQRLLVGDVVRDLEQVDVAVRDLDVLALTSGEAAGEMRVAAAWSRKSQQD